MPPFYDIYGLSNNRDRGTIEKFLVHFCHRDKIENREGQEIFVYKNDKYGIEEKLTPINTMTEVVEYGLKNKNHGFVFYIGDNLKTGIEHIILKFTYDEKIIFGISVQEKVFNNNGELIDNYEQAEFVEQEIASLTNSSKTSIQFEYAPSDDEDEFNKDMDIWKAMNNEKRRK